MSNPLHTLRVTLGDAKMQPPMLEIENLEAGYGPIRALDKVSLEVAAGELVAIIGANGAGTTTLFGHWVLAEVARGGRALVIAHRTELIAQARARLIAQGSAKCLCNRPMPPTRLFKTVSLAPRGLCRTPPAPASPTAPPERRSPASTPPRGPRSATCR
jgi:hypothetical protein